MRQQNSEFGSMVFSRTESHDMTFGTASNITSLNSTETETSSEARPVITQSSCFDLAFGATSSATSASQSSDRAGVNSPKMVQSMSNAVNVSSVPSDDSQGAVGGFDHRPFYQDPGIRDNPFGPIVSPRLSTSSFCRASIGSGSGSGSENEKSGLYSSMSKRHVFDRALEEIVLLMSSDPYQRYLKSDAYRKLMNEPPLMDKPSDLQRVQK